MQKLLTCLAAFAFAATAAAQSPLTSLFASNNSGSAGGAVYFDLTVNTPVTITQIDVNFIGAIPTAPTLDVYTVAGGRAGNMGAQANWTGPSVLGSPVVLTANNTPNVCTLSSPLSLPTGVWGVALVAGGFQHAYTNGNGTNQTYTTLELQFDGGNADNVPFSGGAFSPRVANVQIHYSAGSPGTVFATKANYGQGCVETRRSFYESFGTAAAFDLTSTASGVDNMTLINTGTSYVALTGIATYVAPSPTAATLPLTDDSQTVVTLSGAMPVAGGTTTTLNVCSNAFISTGSNGVGFTPSVPTMLNNAFQGWYSWHDYNPSAGGAVKFEEIAGVAYVTWDGVFSFGATTPETLQFQFDVASGQVSIVWVSISGLGNGHLVGFSMGGGVSDPGSTDLSAALPTNISPAASFGPERNGLALDADVRPIINTTVNLTTSNIGTTAVLGGVLLGFGPLPTPIDLSGIGMPGCFQYVGQVGVLLFFPAGATSATVPFVVPNQLSLNIDAQSAVFDPASGLTPLGATSSNAVGMSTGDW